MNLVPPVHLLRIAEFASVSPHEVRRFKSLRTQLDSTLHTYDHQLVFRTSILRQLRLFLHTADRLQALVHRGYSDEELLTVENEMYSQQPLRDDVSSHMIGRHLAAYSELSEEMDIFTTGAIEQLSLMRRETNNYIISYAAHTYD